MHLLFINLIISAEKSIAIIIAK